MKRYRANELRSFLQAIDLQLEEPVTATVIGGAAIALAFGGDNATTDIDVFAGMSALLQAAAETARAKTGSDIEISIAAVGELPYQYEDRLWAPLDDLKQLRILVPEIYDLVLSKIARGFENDRQHIAAVHKRHKLALTILTERYFAEMQEATMRQRDLELNLLNVVDDLFGSDAARELEGEIERRRKPR